MKDAVDVVLVVPGKDRNAVASRLPNERTVSPEGLVMAELKGKDESKK